MTLTLNCTQGNAMVKGQNNDKSMSKNITKNAVSYTHLDVYKRQN